MAQIFQGRTTAGPFFSISGDKQTREETVEEKRESSFSALTTAMLGYVIGAALTFSKVMPGEPAGDAMSQTFSIARAMAISLTWPLYWGWRLFEN